MNESVQTEKDIGRLIRNYDNKQNEGSRYSLLMTNYDFYTYKNGISVPDEEGLLRLEKHTAP